MFSSNPHELLLLQLLLSFYVYHIFPNLTIVRMHLVAKQSVDIFVS